MITTNAFISIEKKISENVFVLSVEIERYREWIPGMFMQVSLGQKSASEPWLDSRAFSFASWGSRKAKILVRKEGYFTSTLIEKSLDGFTTSIRYPFGNFLINSKFDKIFLAGGAGISVFLSHMDYLNWTDAATERVVIFHSTRNGDEALSKIYWNEIPKNVNLLQFITDKENPEYTGRFSIDEIRSVISNGNYWNFYICGPSSFNAYWLDNLKALGIIPYLEQWVNEVISL